MTRRVKPPAAASVTLARGEHGSPSAARCSASFLHEGKRPIAQSGPNGSPRLGLRFARLDGKVQWMTARRCRYVGSRGMSGPECGSPPS
jgi:hypothetical protein